jgi:YHS domain-containing protein
MVRVLMIAALAVATLAGAGRADRAVYLSHHGLGAGGFDVVAYFTHGSPVPGRPSHRILWKGVVWQFDTEANRERFEADPRAYAPRFGGYCTVAMSRNRLADVDPERGWLIHEGRLYLTHNAQARDLLARDPGAVLTHARANWPHALKAAQ